ncbi:metallophosphoesterase [Affinirhizobium pseudoryzae]|uniref:metallophosphoesterase n=1 Tax=Allorhizobium pseudoryzae TaxID=379684 RepID=UPI0013EC9276|nr:metallophosphoesterase [Allorhizobium pseudoryzae]
MTQEPLLRFGIIADPQYADRDPNPVLNRHFRGSLAKLSEAVATFEGEDLSFVMTLGDLIDRGWESFEAPLSIYQRSRHECLFLPGNHDFLVEPDRIAFVHAALGMPAPYYSFARSGIRFLVIDGCEESLFSTAADPGRHALASARLAALKAKGAENAMDWNAGISDRQFAWIAGQLEAARALGQKVIVMGHYPLHPATDHCLWDAEQLADLLAASPQVIAYLCGHDHRGGLGRAGTCWFVTFKGMVDTPSDNAFAWVDLYADRLEIRGFGREQSRSLPFA